ncbi:MAG: hypothetical protein FIA97_18490 [Methylococcaceae bacterium]|nr:hypothetical protein [Methylococcaceae bacterium]
MNRTTIRASTIAFAGFMSFWAGVGVSESLAQDVVGTWQSQVTTPYCMAAGETILMPDGTFSKTFRCGEMFTLDTGTYKVGEGYIHFNIQDHEPKTWRGKPMHWVKSETVFFQMAGPDRMLCNDRITGGSWEAYRVR